ncbi:glycosyltransferase family protein [Mariniflexile litorale]|uniref:Glycosyltransferase family protein n=1 Tax=Mariniflexile litorale TaxID=3045158 RepID=A0AAU7EKJ1_9FLAO|nr:glycosyltransferase family protein [Mariniflexile sp. KMM 9835]MDQ8211331.1 glycosyltransferase family protein [Mariniflexile sp. KMM 9835]
MNVVVITQARSGSTRLPNKILKEIQERSLLQIHVDRIKKAKLVSHIIIATTTNKEDNKVELLAKEFKVKYFRGSETDVLDRFYQAVKEVKPSYIVRLTSDCPLIDPLLIDEVIKEALQRKLDYYTNVMDELYPDGQDIEVFTFKALEKAWKEATLLSDREHVTSYIRNNSTYKGGILFKSDNHGLKENYNQVRLTVDEPQDFEVIKILVEQLGLDKDWRTYTDYYLGNKEICMLNNKIIRNEGFLKSIKNNL